MKKVSLVVDQFYQQNKIFDESDKIVNRDNCQIHYIELKKFLSTRNIDISTNDINSIEVSDIVIFINMPKIDNEYFLEAKNKKKYLIINELEFIHKDNAKVEQFDFFDKVFTYQDNLIDNKKVFKLNYSFIFPKDIKLKRKFNKKLCCMIAGNKTLKNELELYSKRVKVIEWFENYHKEDFDLFGIGWDLYSFRSDNIIGKVCNRLTFLRKLFAKNYKTYGGKVEDKLSTMSKYKFNICFENAKDVPGWITEKIFDSFFAGTVPVYWGANNIEKYVSKDCFVNMRDFSSHESLYDYLNNMTQEEYFNYVDNIEEFLISRDENYEFTTSYYVNTIFKQIEKDLNES